MREGGEGEGITESVIGIGSSNVYKRMMLDM